MAEQDEEVAKVLEFTCELKETGEAVDVIISPDDNVVQIQGPGKSEEVFCGDSIRFAQQIDVNLQIIAFSRLTKSGEVFSLKNYIIKVINGSASEFVKCFEDCRDRSNSRLGKVLKYVGTGKVSGSYCIQLEEGATQEQCASFTARPDDSQDTYSYILDSEALSLYKEDKVYGKPTVLYFHIEADPAAIQKITLSTCGKNCNIITPKQKFSFNRRQADGERLLILLKDMMPMPKAVFRDKEELAFYLDKFPNLPRLDPPGKEEGAQAAASEFNENYFIADDTLAYFMAVFNEMDSQVNKLESGEQDDSYAYLTWIATETDLSQIVEDGYVPGHSIASGGLNPDSYDHFERSIEDIYDKLLNDKLREAFATVQGLQEVFKESKYSTVVEFVCQREITIMKKIFLYASHKGQNY